MIWFKRFRKITGPLQSTRRIARCWTMSCSLTKDATKISKGHHERLRAAGFDDKAILQITLIASWFNYINRVADALGVGRD